jgi:hypothetical protein
MIPGGDTAQNEDPATGTSSASEVTIVVEVEM